MDLDFRNSVGIRITCVIHAGGRGPYVRFSRTGKEHEVPTLDFDLADSLVGIARAGKVKVFHKCRCVNGMLQWYRNHGTNKQLGSRTSTVG